MKIRSGFVSNSSSSSFICSKQDYSTVYDLALVMLEIRNKDDNFWDKHNEVEVLKELKESKSENIPIAFQTCNYETYIFPTENYYFVSTCNNHPFEEDVKYVKYTEDEDVDDVFYKDVASILQSIDFEVYMANHEDIQGTLVDLNYYYWPQYDKYLKVAKGLCKHNKDYIEVFNIKDMKGVYCYECLADMGKPLSRREQIEKYCEDFDIELLLADGFDDAFIGYAVDKERAVYNYDKCIEILGKDMSEEEAIEYFDFNVIDSYVGEKTPIFIKLF